MEHYRAKDTVMFILKFVAFGILFGGPIIVCDRIFEEEAVLGAEHTIREGTCVEIGPGPGTLAFLGISEDGSTFKAGCKCGFISDYPIDTKEIVCGGRHVFIIDVIKPFEMRVTKL